MDIGFATIAGTISTVLFALSALPMLVKAARTKDLSSYSLGNISLSNLGNVVHSVYVFHLPPGPIWVLHSFYVVSTGLMLFWYVRYARRSSAASPERPGQVARDGRLIAPELVAEAGGQSRFLAEDLQVNPPGGRYDGGDDPARLGSDSGADVQQGPAKVHRVTAHGIGPGSQQLLGVLEV